MLASVYLSQYSKEFFVLPLAIMLLLARRSIAWELDLGGLRAVCTQASCASTGSWSS